MSIPGILTDIGGIAGDFEKYLKELRERIS